jgi:outer membrane lipoprotein-sorting protein
VFKFFFISIFLILLSNTHANNKDKIIENLQNTENFNFKFEQNINGKIENGNCTIQYPKKIYCKYLNKDKILVSNGKSLVIKTKSSFYRYPLKKTPLNLILDKDFLVKKIVRLNEKILDKTNINFSIVQNDIEINIFFDNITFNLVGWQTKDIYQNFNITFLSSIQKNQQVNKDLFKLPSQN